MVAHPDGANIAFMKSVTRLPLGGLITNLIYKINNLNTFKDEETFIFFRNA